LATVFDDPNDDFILELAVSAKARYIVTHNLRNFAGVERFGIEAITPAQMLVKLRRDKMKPSKSQIPEPVLKQAQELAKRENVPLKQIISLAVAQAIGVWANESYMALAGKTRQP